MKHVMDFEKTDLPENEIYDYIDLIAVGLSENQLIRVTVEPVWRPIDIGSRWRGKDGIVRVVEHLDTNEDLLMITYRRESDGWKGQQYRGWWYEFNTYIGHIHDEIQDP